MVVVIGLGSMGKRRIRLMKAIIPALEVVGVDTSAERRGSVFEQLGIKTYASVDDALAERPCTMAFVCTSPISHSEIIMRCLERDLHIFSELNLVSDNYRAMTDLASSKKRILFLSSTLLYRKDLQFISKRVQNHRVNYIYHVGQYLPDWHPWESYKSYFVGDKRTNGCRELFAIDLPWILGAFGEVASFTVLRDKNTSLEVEYDDNYIVTILHKNGNKGAMCVDVVARKAVRVLEVYSEDLHLFWNGTPDSLFEYNFVTREKTPIVTYSAVERDAKYSDNIIENAYADEILTFFDLVDGQGKPRYTFNDDFGTLQLIDRIEGI